MNTGAERILGDLVPVKASLARLYTQWSVRGPTLEASTALAALAQEEAAHARAIGRLSPQPTPPPDCPLPSLLRPVDSWPELIAYTALVEASTSRLLHALMGRGEETVRRMLPKLLDEERYHRDFLGGWCQVLLADDPAVRSTLQSAAARITSEVAGWWAGMRPALEWAGVSLDLDVLASDACLTGPGGSAGTPGQFSSLSSAGCLHCGAEQSETLSRFGSSLLTRTIRCRQCGSLFEEVRGAEPSDG